MYPQTGVVGVPYLKLRVMFSLFGLAMLRDRESGAIFLRVGRKVRRISGPAPGA